ncbi:four-carbon acid sugar kinase family protein [Prochlorococcus marinus]|uniref:Four-carbon acid sugar kinase family protein n=1 Tax=Prochlorococcus marinus (strain MIT 9211) TaxID=93059 RepID=A9BCT7_PROM4|nr:four-carbon acid sugar kinase family protein [Prochlorococcus marinus]ABX09649.1 Conserved hypothetical protein [Prochlorococcus marinus str. MIT 9211]
MINNNFKKIIVFDDDPTGSQTVFDCPLLLTLDEETILRSLKLSSPLLFLLANTRSLSPYIVEARTKEICQSLLRALKKTSIKTEDVLFISRGDSTLRGHGILEPYILNEELGPFDATFHVPAFFEGGRTTVDDVHLLDGIPVHKSIFARDKVFGYSTSYLPKWLQEKSKGSIVQNNVSSISISDLEQAISSESGMKNLLTFLSKLSCNEMVVVNANLPKHLDVFAFAIKTLKGKKRFLFRSAASLLNAISKIDSSSNSIKNFSDLRVKNRFNKPRPGLVLVGSHVQLADDQLERLLTENACIGVELPLDKIRRILEEECSETLISELKKSYAIKIKDILYQGKTPVLYTTRRELKFDSSAKRLTFGLVIAQVMAALSSEVIDDIGYIISKGGITTHILLSEGLKLDLVHLKGQIIPGISVVSSYNKNQLNLPIITFPGNLGNQNTLLDSWKIMESKN